MFQPNGNGSLKKRDRQTASNGHVVNSQSDLLGHAADPLSKKAWAEGDNQRDDVSSGSASRPISPSSVRTIVSEGRRSNRVVAFDPQAPEDVTKLSVWQRFKLEAANFVVALTYIWTDTKRHRRDWLIGLCTVLLVVWFVSLLQNGIAQSPIIFLKLAEDQVGEYDLLLTPAPTSSNAPFWLNFTALNEDVSPLSTVQGACPRWVALGNLANPANDSDKVYTSILVIDSQREKDIGLGRAWSLPPLGVNETYVSNSVLRSLKLKNDGTSSIRLTIDVLEILSKSGAFANQSPEDFIRQMLLGNLNLNFTLPNNGSIFGFPPNILPPGPWGPNTTVSIPNFGNFTLQQLVDLIQPFFPGANITTVIDILEFGSLPANNITGLIDDLIASVLPALVFTRDYTVKGGLDEPLGKWPTALGNVAILESKYMLSILQQVVDQIRSQIVIPDLSDLSGIAPLLPQQFEDALGRVINITEQINATLSRFNFNNVSVDSYALMVIVMYKDRFTSYIKDQDGLNADMISFTNQVSDAIGYAYPASFALPIAQALTPLYFIRLFLDQIFTFVAIVFIVLGALLIYALLLSNVEQKTYEYGMLRALGMRQYVLIELLTVQSLSFSIPGIGIGLLLSFLTFIPIAYFISSYALSPLNISMDGLAAGIGVLLGFCIPLIAIVAPIQRALSRTLRDALDIYHQVQSEVTVRVIKLEKLGLSPWQIAGSVTMIVMGFVTYYVIPYTFTFGNLPLFFFILTIILLGLLFGLSMIGQTLQPYAERLCIHCIVWGADRSTLSTLIRKNLSAHGRRNIKTAIMFTTALSFIIFAGVSFALQTHTISDTVQLATGADLMVISATGGGGIGGGGATGASAVYLNEDGMRSYLDFELSRGSDSLVRSYSFTTGPLLVRSGPTRSSVGNLAGYPEVQVQVYGVEQNLLQTTYDRFYRPTDVDPEFTYRETADGKPDTVNSLYVDAGKATLPQEDGGIKVPPDVVSQDRSPQTNNTGPAGNSTQQGLTIEEAYTDYVDVLVSEALRLRSSIDTATPLRLQLYFKPDPVNTTTITYLAKSRALIGQMPGFFFSSYRQTAANSPVLVSMPQYYRMMKDMYDLTRNPTSLLPSKPPKAKLQISLRPGASKTDREAVANGVRTYIDSQSIQILSSQDLVESTSVGLTLITLFFNVVAVIATVLCFFVLFLSFTANINENSWEFGVLRAVGLNSFKVIRMYIYEALCLIISSVLIGIVIGMLVAITLTLQFNLFTELAFTFDFPYALFFSVVGMSFVVAIVGSYLPARTLKNKEIAIALKNN